MSANGKRMRYHLPGTDPKLHIFTLSFFLVFICTPLHDSQKQVTVAEKHFRLAEGVLPLQ
jgi:hypothetical protein